MPLPVPGGAYFEAGRAIARMKASQALLVPGLEPPHTKEPTVTDDIDRRLAALGSAALADANHVPTIACASFVPNVVASPAMLMALFRITHAQVEATALDFLYNLAGGSQGGVESQAQRDLAPDEGAAASHPGSESQACYDLAVAPLPVKVRAHKRHAPNAKIKGANLAALDATAFDLIVVYGKPLGDYRYSELAPTADRLVAAGVGSFRDAYVMRRLIKSVAYSPAMADQVVRDWADEETVQVALRRVDELRESAMPFLAAEVGMLIDREALRQ